MAPAGCSVRRRRCHLRGRPRSGSDGARAVARSHMEGRTERGPRSDGDPTVNCWRRTLISAMLIESCAGHLPRRNDQSATGQLSQLRCRPPSQPFGPLGRRRQVLGGDECRHGSGRGAGPRGARRARTPDGCDVLLTDLHRGQRRAQREPWLVIDPKPSSAPGLRCDAAPLQLQTAPADAPRDTISRVAESLSSTPTVRLRMSRVPSRATRGTRTARIARRLSDARGSHSG